MKLFLFLLTITLSLFANNDTSECTKATTITKSELFSASVTPDKLSTKLIISITEKEYAKTSNEVNSLSATLKKYERICKSSGYSIVKATEWDSVKKKNIFIGYRGNLSFECKYYTPSEMEKLYNEPLFKKLVRRRNNVVVTNQGTRWVVSDDAIKQKKEELETSAIVYSDTYTKKLSKLLNKTCTTKNINLSSIQQYPSPASKRNMMLSKAIADSIAPAEPSKKDIDVKYSANYIFACE